MTKNKHIELLVQSLYSSGVQHKTLKELCVSIRTGLNPRQNFVLNVPDAALYYVTVKEITTGKIVFSDKTDRITKDAWQRIQERSMLEKDDILFSGIGTIGKVAIVDIPTDNWNCSESVFLIKPNKSLINPKYLMYILGSDFCKEQYESDSVGSTLKGVRKGSLESLKIPVPSKEIQDEIVRELDTFVRLLDNIDDEIIERERQNYLYREHVFNMDEDDGVELKTLEQVVSKNCSLSYGIVQPGDDVDNGVPVVRPVDFAESLFVKREGLKRTTKSISDSYKRTILNGDEILICVRGTTGTMGLATKELKGCNVTRGIVPISFDNEITKKFVFHQLRCSRLKNAIEEKTNGTALRQINVKDLRQLPIYLPSLKEQQAIAAKLDTIEAFIANLNEERTLRQQQYEYYRAKLISLLK